jgi:ABC-2 type transport system ATP-binding protein
VRLLDGAGLEPTAVTVREPSLDDVFLTLTGKRMAPDDDNEEASR